MDFKRKKTKEASMQPDGHIEQRIVDMAKLYDPQLSLTGIAHKLSQSNEPRDRIAGAGVKYAVKIIGKMITEYSEDDNWSDGDIVDLIYDKLWQ